MNKNQVFGFFKSEKAFTLIELLVVIAIIGILSSVVVVSINSAREKGKIASIKSTLKQLYNQAAINQVINGSFAGSNPLYFDLSCTGIKEDGTQGDITTGNLAKIAQPLIDQGVVVKCFSYININPSDPYSRFAATALIYDSGELKAWSVDENGVVKWDAKGVDSSGVTLTGSDEGLVWKNIYGVTVAVDACAKNGGRLPSLEQVRTLSLAWYSEALFDEDADPWAPFGFRASSYWSSTPAMPFPAATSYFHSMGNGYMAASDQNASNYVRCVR